MKKFCKFLRELAMEIIRFKKEKITVLTNEQQKSYENAKKFHICKQKFENGYAKDKRYWKGWDH